MFDTMTDLEEVELVGDRLGGAIIAMNWARFRNNADCGSPINYGDIKDESSSPVPSKLSDDVVISADDVQDTNNQSESTGNRSESTGNQSESTERDIVTPLIMFPKLKKLQIVDGNFSHPCFAGLTLWLESRKRDNRELDLLSLEICRYLDLNKVEGYRKHVKEVIWDGSLYH